MEKSSGSTIVDHVGDVLQHDISAPAGLYRYTQSYAISGFCFLKFSRLPCISKTASIYTRDDRIATSNNLLAIFIDKFLISEFKSSRRTGSHQSKWHCSRNEINHRSDKSVIVIELLSTLGGAPHTRTRVPQYVQIYLYHNINYYYHKLLAGELIFFNWNNETAFVRRQTWCCHDSYPKCNTASYNIHAQFGGEGRGVWVKTVLKKTPKNRGFSVPGTYWNHTPDACTCGIFVIDSAYTLKYLTIL